MGKCTYIVLIWTALVGILLAQTAAAVTLTVEDAGSDGACTNAWPPSIVGNYAENGTLNGAPHYDSPGGWYIYRVNIWGANNWVVSNTLGSADYNNSTIAFYQVSSAATPPLGSSYTNTNSACGRINLVSGGTATPPPAPTIYNLNSGMLPYISGGSTTVAWSAVTGAIGYKLDVATNSSFTTFVAGYNGLVVTASPTPPTSKTVTGLTGPGTTYYFRVRAYNSVGDSANSATLSTTAVPAAPTATAASGISGSAFQANWNAQTGAASYKLYVCTNSGFTTCLAGFNPASVSGTSASVTGLSPGTTYYYRLKASNENGDSGVSNTISLTTNALPTLGGTFTTAGAVNDNSTIAPFAGVTVADANGNNVSITITYAAANGTLTGTGLSGTAGNYLLAAGAPATTTANLQGLVFHPTLHQGVPGATVVTTFTLRPSDGIDNGAANSSTVVTTTMVNTAPAFAGATTTLTVDRNSGATDVKGLLHVSDTDSGQTLTWTQQAAPAHGTLTVSGAATGSGGTDIAPGGTITYQPTADYYGADSFTVQVSDGMDTTTRTIAVTVNWSAEVLSIDRAGASPTNAASVDWNVSFNDSVTGIAASHFSLTNPGGGLSGYSVTGFSGSGNAWTVTVNPGTGKGTLQLDMVNGTGVTPPLTNLAFAGQQYAVDTVAPAVTDGNISISGASGTGGAYKIGDTVTATWNNTAGGDSNNDISSVTVDFSQFGGGAAVAATNAAGTWTATYTIISGTVDGSNKNVSVTATDNAGNTTSTADTSNATVDNVAPTVTNGNISISGASGTGGAFKIGDTVTATWNNTAGGDNNSDTITGVTVDFSAFGGGAAVAAANAAGSWTATYTIISGTVDGSNKNVSVTATDNAGNTTSTADTSNATVDNVAPTVTNGNISISGASGTGGAFKIGDTVTATWNNTAGGDNNSDTITGVTVDFSAFGGGAAVAAANAAGTWTATYTIVAGVIDAGNRNVYVTATDNAGNASTTADTTNATVDNVAPTVTNGNISISGASGTGGAFKIGDTVTATWNNTAGGDNNSDTITGVTVDFSAFGGGAAVAATNSAGTWTATYTIVAGAIDAGNRNVSVTATDNAGNATTTADTSNATLDNQAPTVTDGNISISGASGTGGAYKIGDTVTVTWNNTAGGDNNVDTISSMTVDFSAFGGGAAVAAVNASGTWTATYTIVAGAIDGTNKNINVTAMDNEGNASTTADTSNASVDNIAPTVSNGNISISGATGTGGAYKIGDTVTATWDNTAGGDNNSDTIAGVTVDFSAFGGGAAVAAVNVGGTWTATYTIGAGAIDGSNKNISVTATDNAGNATTTADTANATLDNVAPTVSDGNISISGATGTGGAYKIGDTVTATWDNTSGGDSNTDISGVTVDFSAFGGGVAVAAFNAADTWTATYTVIAGAIDAGNSNVFVTATDNAGNATTTADTANATVDSVALTVSDANISISGATGTGGAYKIGDTVTATWDNTAGGDNNSDTVTGVTVDFSAFGGGAAVAATNSAGTWTATYIIFAGAIDGSNKNVFVTATDNAGNATTTADTANATLDNIAPAVSNAYISLSGASGTGGAYKIGDTVTATWDNTAGGDNNSDTISGVTVDFSAFGGGAAVTAVNAGGTWTAAYTIGAGAIDGSNKNISVTATDNAGNATTTADTTNATVDNVAPTVSDANIGISGASGTGGAYRIGDTVTATWDNTSGGDSNTDISGVTVDFSAFGGGAAVAAVNAGGAWTATFTIVAGAIDGSNKNISVTATDNAGNATTTADSTNATVDSQAPTVTDGNISISGATGTGGAFKIGDTVTATWNNTPGGDNNGDTISSVTVDFSQFGGGAAVAAANAGGTWTAAFTITSGALDAANRNILVTSTDNGGNATTTADTSNATVDSQAPAVTDAYIGISGATGTGGTYKIGDTVTMSWNNTASGDNNSDTISSVTADFSQFGGGAAVAAANAGDTWTAAYTITSGTVDAANRNVSVTAIDNAGNAATTADTSNATVDSQAPAVTDANISISGATGTGGAFKVGDTVTMNWDNRAAGDNNDDISTVTADFSQFGGGAAVAAINTGDTWSAAYTITEDGGGSIDATNLNVSVTAVDNAGNSTTTLDSTNAAVDNDSPAVPSTPDMADLSDTGSSSTDNITNNASPTFGGTGDANIDLTLHSSLDGAVGTATSGADGSWSVTPSLLTEGTHDITATAADPSGNTSTSPALVVVIDTTVPVLNGMPANILTNTDPGQATAVVSWTESTVTDNVDSSLLPAVLSAPTAGLANGSAFPLGTTTMTFQATDSAGNSSLAASFSVTVVDNEPPIFSGVPADITVSTLSSSRDTAIVTWTAPTAADNVDGAVIPLQTAGPPSGSEFPVGTTTIVYTATDSQGNISTASFTVAVKQAKFPWEILLPALVSPNKVSGAGTAP